MILLLRFYALICQEMHVSEFVNQGRRHLRRKLLEAHQQGEGSLEQLAVRFRVSVSWAKRISMMLGRTGRMERPPAGP
ncbi:MAG: hypothetical protein EXQ47_11850, partial [Bryobacterales bacterium]|nr:hypothetical protein [Bryobacterales bacterium]